jgi:hypothetical protein
MGVAVPEGVGLVTTGLALGLASASGEGEGRAALGLLAGAAVARFFGTGVG